MYFRLSDEEKQQIPCVLWKGVGRALATPPRDGLLVSLTCWIQRSPRGGLELDVRDLEVRGSHGPRSSAREVLRQGLTAEGLMDAARKRPLPERPTCLGVVTSLGGAAIRALSAPFREQTPGCTRNAEARDLLDGASPT